MLECGHARVRNMQHGSKSGGGRLLPVGETSQEGEAVEVCDIA